MNTSIQHSARGFKSQLAEHALEVEASGMVAPQTLQELRSAGLLNLLSPKCYKGSELGFASVLAATSELAEGCMSTAWVATVGLVHNWMATGFSEAAQHEYFADPDVYSAASFAPTGRGYMTQAGFTVTGRWGFLSGVDHANWVFVAALVDKDENFPDRQAGPWFMMVPIEDLQIDHDSWNVSGLRGTGSKDVVLEDVHIPFHRAAFLPHLSTGKGPGVHLHEGATFKTPFQPALIAVLAIPILGASKMAVKAFTDYTAGRVMKMTGAKQAEQTPTQILLAHVSAKVDTAELIMHKIMETLDSGLLRTPADFAKINRDAAFAATLMQEAVNQIMANSGGSALQETNVIQRIWRDVNAACNHAALNWSTQAQNWGRMALENND